MQIGFSAAALNNSVLVYSSLVCGQLVYWNHVKEQYSLFLADMVKQLFRLSPILSKFRFHY